MKQHSHTEIKNIHRSKPEITPVFRLIVAVSVVLACIVCGFEWLFQQHLAWFASANLSRLVVAAIFLLGLMPLATQSVNRRWLRYVSRAQSILGGDIRIFMRLSGFSLIVVGWISLIMVLMRPMELQNIILEKLCGIEIASPHEASPRSLSLTPVLVFFSTVAIYSGTILMNGAKRAFLAQSYREPASEEILGQVVYFRSFAADVNPGYESGYFKSFKLVSEEEAMASIFEEKGRRVYAIGRPGESLPLLGARRIYCNDDEWQSRVLSMIEVASLAIIRPEATRHVMWEIGQITSKVSPNKIFLWVPPSASQFSDFSANDDGNGKSASHWQRFCDNCDTMFHGQLASMREHVFPFDEPAFLGFNEDWSVFVFPTPPITDQMKRNRSMIRSVIEHAEKCEGLVKSSSLQNQPLCGS